MSVSYDRQLVDCLAHTVTGCSGHELTSYNDTIITVQSSIITQLCPAHDLLDQHYQLGQLRQSCH